MTCRSGCRDEVRPWRCSPCGATIKDQCADCHNEITHGRVKDVTYRPMPRHAQYRKPLDDGGEEASEQNGVRVLEDCQ